MLEIRDLVKVFNPQGINEVHSLNGVDLHLEDGEFVTLIGSNGAGKTTLFNTIAGVYPPSRGQILIDGQNVTAWPEHRRAALVGRVFQDPLMGTAETMTIAENLTLALLRARKLRLRKGVTRERRLLFLDLLKPLGLGLEDRLDARISLLSGGQRQALTLLMASLSRPSILLLDEHTAALDPTTAEKILHLTGELVIRERLTTMMITHNLKLALEYGNRTLMMDRGKIVLDLGAEEKAGMTVNDLLDKFANVRNERLMEDRMLLGVAGMEQ
jgi:putative ABC transport system ATP-binding protein